jgi:hypothetical protein
LTTTVQAVVVTEVEIAVVEADTVVETAVAVLTGKIFAIIK